MRCDSVISGLLPELCKNLRVLEISHRNLATSSDNILKRRRSWCRVCHDKGACSFIQEGHGEEAHYLVTPVPPSPFPPSLLSLSPLLFHPSIPLHVFRCFCPLSCPPVTSRFVLQPSSEGSMVYTDTFTVCTSGVITRQLLKRHWNASTQSSRRISAPSTFQRFAQIFSVYLCHLIFFVSANLPVMLLCPATGSANVLWGGRSSKYPIRSQSKCTRERVG